MTIYYSNTDIMHRHVRRIAAYNQGICEQNKNMICYTAVTLLYHISKISIETEHNIQLIP